MAAEQLTPLSELPPIDPEADQRILRELAEPVIPLINRHINMARYNDPELKHEFPTVTTYMGDNADLWVPAMLVPWSLGENFPKDYVWTPEESPLPEAAVASLILGLLTEDTLPWYSEAIVRNFGSNEAFRFFANVWTAEEGRHADSINGYVITARLVDPIQLEHDRMANVITARVPDPPSVMESLLYVAIQELATRISHQNTGKLIADTAKADDLLVALGSDRTTLANVEPTALQKLDPILRQSYIRQTARALFTRVAGDENKHHIFYLDSSKAAIVIDESTVVKALEKQIRGFQMPGTGIRDYDTLAVTVAEAGVYDPIIHNSLLKQVIGKLGIENLTGLDSEAERARERIFSEIGHKAAKAVLWEERRAARRAQAIDNPDIIWVGKKAA